jgi:hypothetical protein
MLTEVDQDTHAAGGGDTPKPTWTILLLVSWLSLTRY